MNRSVAMIMAGAVTTLAVIGGTLAISQSGTLAGGTNIQKDGEDGMYQARLKEAYDKLKQVEAAANAANAATTTNTTVQSNDQPVVVVTAEHHEDDDNHVEDEHSEASFYARKRIGQKTWRAIHYISFLTFIMVTLHGFYSGTDPKTLAMQVMYLTSAAA